MKAKLTKKPKPKAGDMMWRVSSKNDERPLGEIVQDDRGFWAYLCGNMGFRACTHCLGVFKTKDAALKNIMAHYGKVLR